MAAMTHYIHEKGLKAGLYISPGPSTCAGYEGSYGHEALDARIFADWEFDFLKYDWCSYGKIAGGKERAHFIKPYEVMWGELQKQDRDIVLNLCQYGMDKVWEWGGNVGNCWRTTGDLGLEQSKDLPGFYYIGFSNAQHWEYARPGAWNDPDYILIGWVGNAHEMGIGTPTSLTPYEQYSYMSMWCLMAAPLIFSGDMARLDAFTLNVLCNHEVIAVDQDLLGKQARIIRQTDTEFILAKDMEDGSKAIGIFNLLNKPANLGVSWSDIDIKGQQLVRDLWRQTDLGIFENAFSSEIPPHGVTMIRIWPK
jgi:alpha-galactosidase